MFVSEVRATGPRQTKGITDMETQAFESAFFSRSMNQIFNAAGWEFVSDENESALSKYVRAITKH